MNAISPIRSSICLRSRGATKKGLITSTGECGTDSSAAVRKRSVGAIGRGQRREAKVRPDSPLERDGFEPSVPRRKRRGAYRRYKDLLVRRGPLERWYDFYNNAEESFAGVVRGETCLRS